MSPEEEARLWVQENPPPPLTDEQVTALRALLHVEELATQGLILRKKATA